MMTPKNQLTKQERLLERDRTKMFNELERQKLQLINNIKNKLKRILFLKNLKRNHYGRKL